MPDRPDIIATPAPPSRRLYILAAALLAVTAASSAFTLVWDDDIHWHIAGGKWMLEHRQILRHDPFAVGEVPGKPNEWVNVHWLFQLLMAGIHETAGFEGISVFRSVMAALWMVAFSLVLYRRVSPGWLLVAGLISLVVIAGRIRARPETFTYLFLLLTVATVESVRQGANPRRMWWLVPMMLLWANMHVLCVLALGVIVSGIGGAWLECRLRKRADPRALAGNLLTRTSLLAAAATILICVATPWPGTVFSHSLLLSTRLSGAVSGDDASTTGPQVYSHTISELHPVWSDLVQAPLSHPALAIMVLLTAAVLVLNVRHVRLAHLVWVLTFTGLALVARRNIAMVGPACGYLVAFHGQQVLDRFPGRWKWTARLALPLTLLLLAASAALTFGYLTEWVFCVRNEPQRIGAGIQQGVYPVATARFLGALDADGDIECDNLGDASAFIQYSTPRRKVFMDGRLEVNSQKRFLEHAQLIRNLRHYDTVDDASMPPTVRFVVVRASADVVLCSLSHSRRFELIHMSPDAACFARLDWPAPCPLPAPDTIEYARLRKAALALAGPTLAPFDRPLSDDGLRVEGTPRETSTWYRRNPRANAYHVGQMFLGLGRRPSGWTGKSTPMHQQVLVLAVRYLTAATTEEGIPPLFSQGMLAKAHQELGALDALDWQLAGQQTPGADETPVPVNVHLASAVREFDRMDLAHLENTNVLTFAVQKGYALFLSGQWEAAHRYMDDMVSKLPAPEQTAQHRLTEYFTRYTALRTEAFRLRAEVARRYASSITEAGNAGLETMDRWTRARILRERFGLMQTAQELLENIPTPTSVELLMLGDLHLQQGRTDRARKTYARLSPSSRTAAAVPLRLALCDWIEGDRPAAARALRQAAQRPNAADADLACYYQAMLAELTGHYALARQSLHDGLALANDPALKVLIEQMTKRLANR